jgi:hypothetical protein
MSFSNDITYVSFAVSSSEEYTILLKAAPVLSELSITNTSIKQVVEVVLQKYITVIACCPVAANTVVGLVSYNRVLVIAMLIP